jgi:hypothetical protein
MKRYLSILFVGVSIGFFSVCHSADAANLKLSPETGVYTVGNTFTVNVVVQTGGKSVNAAEGQIAFNPRELSVVSATRATSIFGLWTQEPTFSNTTGSVTFGGGSPTGYSGATGIVMSITFKALAPGTPKVTFKTGSLLAADGFGTNVLASMGGGSYTVSAKADTPEPEYIAPANTPSAPKLVSDTHPDPAGWYTGTTFKVRWDVPEDVVAVRVLLDQDAGTIPTIVYEERISDRSIDELPQGESYFHIQFKNSDGWGKVTHFRIGVDSEVPSRFEIREDGEVDISNPVRTLLFDVADTSPILKYRIYIDGQDAVEFVDVEGLGRYALPKLSPGSHSVLVEAFDSAGNMRAASYTFEVSSFEAPSFTEYPDQLGTNVVPALRGTTKPEATVIVTVAHLNGGVMEYTTVADRDGKFTFIPDGPFPHGVVEVSAIARDAYGGESNRSEIVRIIVAEPGFVRIGTFVLSVLSVIIPLVSLVLLLAFGTWLLWHRLVSWRRRAMKETLEAEQKLRFEFDELICSLNERIESLRESRKGKLTKAESELVLSMEQDLRAAQTKIQKEITDIENLIR